MSWGERQKGGLISFGKSAIQGGAANKYLVFATLAWGLLAAGCGPTIRYGYTPPASAEGRVCTSQCANAQQQCHSQQDANYRACQRQHDIAMRNYHACQEAKGKQCQSPPSCYSGSRSDCDNPYNACYTNCGGTIQAIQVN